MIHRRTLLASALSSAACAVAASAQTPAIIRRFQAPRPADNLEHAVVYRREDEFCAWTYTRGFWETANGDLIQNFDAVTVNYTSADAINHNNVFRNSTGRKIVTVRSTDRGRTWNGDHPDFDLIATSGASARPFAEMGPIDYLDRDVLLYSFSPGFGTPAGRAPLRVSKDGGRSWSGESELPLDGLHSLTALNSYLVRPDGRCLLFMFEVSADGNRRPLVYGSLDGGTEFHFMSFITEEHDPKAAAKSGRTASSLAFAGHRWFYPRAIMLPNGRILCSLRCQRDPTGDMWTEIYYSDDGGRTWGFLSRVNDFGAPGSLIRMSDGRLVVVYGYRLQNYGIRAVVSEDEGLTWGNELIVRDDGGSWDLGYPNAWEVEPGKIGCIYYFNSMNDEVKVNGGQRHIARSIFTV
ncbi:MAG: exo-alpha-sialidase [Gammaproteobacteria bacterium]|nr:exo-alpha-sialidase [Gammaproteobacteria bacterium]